jgi:hypothetical protein
MCQKTNFQLHNLNLNLDLGIKIYLEHLIMKVNQFKA